MRSKRLTPGKVVAIFILIIGIFIALVPILYIISMSLMSAEDYFHAKLIPSRLFFTNYLKAWKMAQMGVFYKNSIIVCSASVLVTLCVSSLAGYAFARFRLPGGQFVYYALLLAMIIPPQILLIPLFVNLRTLRLLNTYLALIGPYTALGFAFGMFILKGFFELIPTSIEESAIIEGARKFRIFLSIMLPLARPAVATVTIFLFLTNWNEFLIALTFITDVKLKTLPVGVYSLMSFEYYEDYTTLAAALVIFSVPVMVVFFIFQKQFIKSLVAGAIKG